MNKAIVNDLNTQTKEVQEKIQGLQNVSRLIGNTLSLLNEVEKPGIDVAKAIVEIEGWLTGFNATVKSQVQALQTLLPKPETPPISIPVIPEDATIPQVVESPVEAK